ncbi:MAG: pirin family protein [Marmoricola sp.]
MTIEARDASGRFVTRAEGRTTSHSFSFGSHYHPANIGFGLLVAHNDELLPAGTGYPDHPHADLEIVTFVLTGSLRHISTIGTGVVGPGEVQRLSAGTGVVHAEMSDSPGPTRFVQTWLRPSEPGGKPSCARAGGVSGSGLVPLVGGEGAVGLGAAARLFAGTLTAGSTVTLPDAPRLHVFVTDGVLRVGDALLGPADAARISDEGGRWVEPEGDCRFLVWVC